MVANPLQALQPYVMKSLHNGSKRWLKDKPKTEQGKGESEFYAIFASLLIEFSAMMALVWVLLPNIICSAQWHF